VDEHMEVMERAMENPGALSGIQSVIPALGRTLGGYQRGETYLVGARPGVGKTSFLLSEALHMAQGGKVVAIASLEMTRRRLTSALVAMLCGVPSKVIDEGSMTPAQYSEYVKASGVLAKLPIYIEDDPGMTPRQLIGKARKLKQQHGLDVLMVDYVQLMEPTNTGRRYESETAEVAAVSRALVRAAKVLNVPLLAAVQLNRAVEERADKHPQLSDLKQTSQLEQDATAVIFPFRPALYQTPVEPSPAIEEVELAIAKNRYGPIGMVRCAFRPVLKQFVPSHTVNLSALAEGRAS
jgi:replicative DNA helicase